MGEGYPLGQTNFRKHGSSSTNPMFEFIPGKDIEYTKDEDHICDALLGFSVKTLSMNSLSSSGWKVEGTMT